MSTSVVGQWGDLYASVGVQTSTKQVGEISGACLCGSARARSADCPQGWRSKDCSTDRNYLTSQYKKRELSASQTTAKGCKPVGLQVGELHCAH